MNDILAMQRLREVRHDLAECFARRPSWTPEASSAVAERRAEELALRRRVANLPAGAELRKWGGG
jgi:hypothetical protein